MKSTPPASTNPFGTEQPVETSIKKTTSLGTNPFDVKVPATVIKEETKSITVSSKNPFGNKPEEKIQEETKPFLPSSEPNPSNQNPEQLDSPNEKPAPLPPMWTGRFKVVKQKAHNLILKLPRPDVTILLLMLLDLIAVIVLLVYDNITGSVSMTELLFYLVSVVATVLGVLYLCGTKPPRDMMKLFDRNKNLLTEYDQLAVEHTEVLACQREEVNNHKRENNRLSSTVITFRHENEELKQNVNDFKSVTE